MYVLIKSGVYRHELIGTATTLERVKELATAFLNDEDDDYHTVEVLESTPDAEEEEKVVLEYGKILTYEGGSRFKNGERSKIIHTEIVCEES